MIFLFFTLLIQFLNEIFVICLGGISIIFLNQNIKIFDSNNDNENTDKLLDYINDNCTSIQSFYYKGKSKPEGLCFSFEKKIICYVFNRTEVTRDRFKTNTKIWYIGKINIEIKSENNIPKELESSPKITIWDKDSDFIDSHIYKFEIPFDYQATNVQEKLINKILENYESSKIFVCRCLIYGNPGCGKSFLGKLITKKLNGQLSTYINLGTPGCGFRHLYRKSCPTKNNPLIIQLDELDVVIENIHNQVNINYKHEWLTTECYNKISYNNFWSEFVIKYPFVIWLCTMNKTPNDINRLDECYLRKNRLDIVIKYPVKED